MAKLGWVTCGLIMALVFGMAAVRPSTDDSAKLDEIKALLQESLRLQRIDLHRRSYKEHPLFQGCDFEKKCEDFESRGRRHSSMGRERDGLPELFVNGEAPPRYFHPFTGECGGYGPSDSCKKVEETFREANKERIEQILKTYKRKE